MWGKVENKKVTKIYRVPEFLKDSAGTTYPKAIFQDDTKLANFGIYPVINTNSKPNYEELYNGVNESYAWNDKDKQVERTYNYSAKALDDTEAKDDDGKNILDEDGNKVINYGLKTILKSKVRSIQSNSLATTDKWIIRKADTNEDVPSTVVTYRKAIRDSATTMETAITNAKDFEAILNLFKAEYNSDGTVKTPATLYNFPSVPNGMPE